MRYSVVITTYNRLELLRECVGRVLTQTLPFAHVIIVDNASTDGTASFLEETAGRDDRVHCRRLPVNSGGAGGFCEGVKEALPYGGDYLLFIDDDAILEPDYLEKIDKAARDSGEEYGAYSGTVFTRGRINYLHRYFLEPGVFFRMRPAGAGCYEGERFVYDLSTFCGLALSMEIIRKIGLPDRELFISYDDTEYCMRARKYTRVVNVNSARLDHREGPAGKGYSWKRYYGYRNKILLGMRYTRLKPVYAAKMAVWHLLRIGKCVCRFLAGKNRRDQLRSIAQHADAWFDGVRGKTGVREKYLPGKNSPLIRRTD